MQGIRGRSSVFSKRSQTFPVGDAVAVLSKMQLETD